MRFGTPVLDDRGSQIGSMKNHEDLCWWHVAVYGRVFSAGEGFLKDSWMGQQNSAVRLKLRGPKHKGAVLRIFVYM